MLGKRKIFLAAATTNRIATGSANRIADEVILNQSQCSFRYWLREIKEVVMNVTKPHPSPNYLNTNYKIQSISGQPELFVTKTTKLSAYILLVGINFMSDFDWP